MSLFDRPERQLLRALCGAVMLAASTLAAQPNPPDSGTVGLVERLIRAAFPELEQRRLTVSLSFDHGTHPWRDTHDAFLLMLEEGEPPPVRGDTGVPGPFLRGIFQFHNGGYDTVSFLGRHVHQAEVNRLATLLRATPMTVMEIDAILRKAGARFGPSQRAGLEAAIAQSQLLSVLGVHRVESPEFLWPSDSSDSAVTLGWLVRAEGQSPDLRLSCLALRFEPFDGRLVRVRQWSPQQADPTFHRCVPPAP